MNISWSEARSENLETGLGYTCNEEFAFCHRLFRLL